ncbi:MAG TPA: cupredoxin family copper-binding protein [Candidatus Limnocylindrales bacterium]|nr:cupredoxin family copper-binding protein [Candidatus Limnocylindrales bacterium]
MDRRRLVAAGGALALVIGVGAGSVQAADRDVAISGFSFSPRTVTVKVGDSVTWTNSDAQTHTATSGSAWNTGDIGNGESKSITMDRAGTFDYICAIHPTMTGTVVVRGTDGAPTTDTLGSTADGPDAIAVTLAALGMLLLASAAVADWIFRGRAARR